MGTFKDIEEFQDFEDFQESQDDSLVFEKTFKKRKKKKNTKKSDHQHVWKFFVQEETNYFVIYFKRCAICDRVVLNADWEFKGTIGK